MIDDIIGGPRSPRRKPKIDDVEIAPKRSAPQVASPRRAASDGGAGGPEAKAAMAFTEDHSSPTEPLKGYKSESNGLNSPADAASQSAAAKRPKHRSGWLHYRLTKWQKITALIVAVLVVVGAGLGVLYLRSSTLTEIAQVNPTPVKPKPQPIYSPLTGEPVTAAQAEMPITGVMIENSIPARPQSGLSDAGVVYEAIAEAGITRFLALYQYENTANIGPIRSARPYFIRWLLGYNAAYAHVGGSPEALQDIKDWNVMNMDQFYNGGSYHRTTSREAPHNVYTSLADLNQLEASDGYKFTSFQGFERKADQPAKTPSATTINVDISGPAYAVKYTYDAKNNDYERYEGGTPHIDANTGQPIAPKVVVALIVPYSQGSLDSSGAYYSVYNNIGSGAAYIFQDGKMTQATWQKSSLTAPLELVDAAGQPIALNRGQVWLTALGEADLLSYN